MRNNLFNRLMTGFRRIRDHDRLSGEALLRAREEWERTFNSMTDLIMILDRDHKIVRANKAMSDKLGIATSETVGLTCYEHVHGLSEPPSFCPHSLLLSDGREHSVEVYEERLGGHYLVTVTPLYDANGGVAGSVHTARDITERKRALDSLRKSEERLKTAQRIAHIGSWELDLGANELTWSDEIYRIFEIDPAAFGASYEAFLNAIHPDDRATVDAAYMQSVTKRTPYEAEHRLRFSDGRIKHVREQCETVYDADGRPLQSVGTVQDITGRKKIENDLKRATEEWERTFDAISDPVMILDTGYRIVKANKAMARAAGVTPGQVAGRSCFELVHGLKAPPDYCPYAELLMDGQARSREIVEPRLGGNCLITVSPLHAIDGTLIGSIHAARDINELKLAEEMSRRYSYDLERLLSVSRDATMTTDVTNLYRSFITTGRDVLGLDFSTLMLLSEDKKTLTVQDCLGFPETLIGHFSLVEGQGLSTWVVKNRKPETVADFAGETRFEVPPIVGEKGIRSAVAVPMMMKDEVIGVLIGHTIARRDFSRNEIDMYQHIANQAAVAIRNALNTEMLRKREKYIQDVTASLSEGVYVLNALGEITFMNPEAEALLGWSEQELLHKNIHDVIHNRRPDETPLSFQDCDMRKVLETGNRYHSTDEMFVRKDGTTFPVSVHSTPLMENGIVVASVTAFRDISERKQIERERERLITDLQKALSEIKTLHGILPTCASCKKIRDEKGAWHQMEAYIRDHSNAQFSHGLCADCAKKLYPEYFGDKER